MNPFVHKYYSKFMTSLYNFECRVAKSPLIASPKAYGNYSIHLLFNLFPRLSYRETFSKAYLPKSVHQNAYIVYGMIIGFLLFEYNYCRLSARSIRNKQEETLN